MGVIPSIDTGKVILDLAHCIYRLFNEAEVHERINCLDPTVVVPQLFLAVYPANILSADRPILAAITAC